MSKFRPKPGKLKFLDPKILAVQYTQKQNQLDYAFNAMSMTD